MYTLNYNSITVLLHQGLKDLSIIFSSIQLLTILGHQYDSDLTELHNHDVIFNIGLCLELVTTQTRETSLLETDSR